MPVDVSSDESVAQAFNHIRHFYDDRITSVIHLAAYYSFNEEHSDKYEKITVEGTRRLLRALQKFEVEQFIFSSTMLVHAPCAVDQKIDENWPLLPKWDYPKSKVRTEEVIAQERGKIPTVIMRIAGVYDDHCHAIPIANQIRRIYENRLTSHFFAGQISHGASFIHLEDLVEAISIAVEKRKEIPPETTLLIGEPATLSYDFLQRRINRLLKGKDLRTYPIPKWLAWVGAWAQNCIPFTDRFIKPWMIPFADDNYTLDISRAKKTLSWEPKHSLEESLPKMIEELKANPKAWFKENHLS